MKYSDMTPEQARFRKEYFRKYHALWYQNNKERLKPIRKAYADAHRADSVKRTQRYVAKHQWKVKEYMDYWNKTPASKLSRIKYYQTLAGKWNSLKSSSKKRKLLLVLSEGEFERLITSPCNYCGSTHSIGIDRVDNSIGYTSDNSVSCCARCNYMKKAMTVSDFLAHITKVFNHTKINK